MHSFVKFKYLLIIIFLSIMAFFMVDIILTKEVETLKINKYKLSSDNLKNQIQNAIENKSISTMNIAIALSESRDLKDFLKYNKTLTSDFKEVSSKIKEFSIYKNVWIHVIDNKGFSKYRSWSLKKDDNVVNIRKELPILFENPKIYSLISVGIFDMTFKNIIPIYDKKEFLGFIEIITKMNSIAEEFKKEKVELVVLADKKYKEQIKKPFTNSFIDDYYVANYNANSDLKKLISKDVEKYINIKDYLIEDGFFITNYLLKDIEGEKLGYFLVFKNINAIDLKDIIEFENFIKLIGILILVILASFISLLYFYNKTKYTNLLEENIKKRTQELNELTKRYTQIFEESKAIKLIIDPINKNIMDANESALTFYGYTKENFLKLSTSDINNLDTEEQDSTVEKVLNAKQNIFHLKHKLSSGEIRDVEIYASPIEIDNKIYIYSIIRDITAELEARKELKNKEQLFYQQAKMASMGEMLENIAHQWRQPLSIISTAASGTKIKKEFDELDDEFLFEALDLIIKSSNYLSHTIDDFRDFFKQSKNKEEFKLLETINDAIKLSNIRNRAIELELHCDDIKIVGFKNEILQVLLNILNNSKYVLDEKELEYKLIKIELTKVNDNALLCITDNGGGIEEDKISKVFEPYFTTKHKSQGTGIGLYMCEQIITKHFNGQISIQNINFEYKGKYYFGVRVKIELPILLNS